MTYCIECGTKLIMKSCGIDGDIPYCPSCQQFRFPMYNSAISAIVFNPQKTKILLIQQYGRDHHILVAGYINKGENAKQALIRELKEEVDLNVLEYKYNDNEYFSRTNTLIHNYAVLVDSEDFHLTSEVDHARWYDIKDALAIIKPDSLAKHFLELYLNKMIEKE